MKQSGIQTVSPKGCRHTAWKSLCLFLAAWLTALTLTACNAAQPIVPATVSPFDSYQSAATSEPAPYPIGDDSKTNPPNSQPSGTEPSSVPTTPSAVQTSAPPAASTVIQLSTIPPFSGEPYVEINGNQPAFAPQEQTTSAFETYSALDAKGRCGIAYACIGRKLMPTEPRGSIGQVKPTGWHTVKYDCVDGKYLYNRCHLIGYQLSGENANDRNLITGTRYLNVEGMLPFENMVADYVKETNNHVLYRVTPVYDGANLLVSGVQIEALSVEDAGEAISFNVFCYNVQPGIVIDYATGKSRLAPDADKPETTAPTNESTYVLNTNTMKFHKPDCTSARQMKPENKLEYRGTRDSLIKKGYAPCGVCKP